jgi:hypothetical protein
MRRVVTDEEVVMSSTMIQVGLVSARRGWKKDVVEVKERLLRRVFEQKVPPLARGDVVVLAERDVDEVEWMEELVSE